jgi:hypothetical protein
VDVFQNEEMAMELIHNALWDRNVSVEVETVEFGDA